MDQGKATKFNKRESVVCQIDAHYGKITSLVTMAKIKK